MDALSNSLAFATTCTKSSTASAITGFVILLGVVGAVVVLAVLNSRSRKELAAANAELNYLRPEKRGFTSGSRRMPEFRRRSLPRAVPSRNRRFQLAGIQTRPEAVSSATGMELNGPPTRRIGERPRRTPNLGFEFRRAGTPASAFTSLEPWKRGTVASRMSRSIGTGCQMTRFTRIRYLRSGDLPTSRWIIQSFSSWARTEAASRRSLRPSPLPPGSTPKGEVDTSGSRLARATLPSMSTLNFGGGVGPSARFFYGPSRSTTWRQQSKSSIDGIRNRRHPFSTIPTVSRSSKHFIGTSARVVSTCSMNPSQLCR